MREKKQINYYEFTQKTSDPCISNPQQPFNKETNRVIKNEEKSLSFLVDNYHSLTLPAIRLMSEIATRVSEKITGEKLSRVGKENVYFGKKWYLIKYVGSFGTKIKNVFLIQEEDENLLHFDRAYKSIIPGKKYIVFSDDDSCPRCLSEKVRFRIKPESKHIRCGVCLGLQGLKKTL